MIAGITEAEELVRQVSSNHHTEVNAAISAPGGCGKSALVSAIADCYRDLGVAVWEPEALREQPAAPCAVLVDDAHLAATSVLDRLEQLITSTDTCVFVAFRPFPRRPELRRLTETIRHRGQIVHLHHLRRREVARRVTATLSVAASDELVDMLLDEAGGLPMLIDQILASLPQDVAELGGEPRMPGDVLERVHRDVERLEPGARALLHAVAIGAELEPATMSRLLRIEPEAVGEVLESAWSTGFLLPDGRAIPIVTDAVMRYMPPERTRSVRQALMHVRCEQHADAVPLARALSRDGVRDQFAADLLVSAADQRLHQEPATAFELYSEAVVAGASADTLALRRAEAAARVGMYDAALQLVDPVLAHPEAPDFLDCVELAATVMAHRGLIGRAAELYAWLGHDRISTGRPTAALALMATGGRDAAAKLVSTETPGPTMANGVRSLMAQGTWESIEGRATTALSLLMRATTLLESASPSLLLPDTPVALTALVAIHIGDLDVAESALRRAIDRDLGGPAASTRHRLLLAWVAMLRGRFGQSRQLIEDGVAGVAEAGWSPRDELFIRGLQLGIARRTSDVAGLIAAWNTGRDILWRHPVDLFVLLPLGEFAIAAARVRESARVSSQLADVWRLLQDLDHPVIWSAIPHWCGVQAAILNNRPTDVEPHATALVRGATDSSFAAALAAAGRAWMEVLVGEVEPASVQAAAHRLQEVGLSWDASRLLAQAAARSRDRRVITTLMQMARALQSPDESATSTGTNGSDRSVTALSARELEVAELLLQGKTYRDIGQHLYIAPKTVEHHVARMKQRIGASGRSDLLTRLRVLVEYRH